MNRNSGRSVSGKGSSGVIFEDVESYQEYEIIRIVHQGGGEQSLTGWSIVSMDGPFVFKMPMSVSLKPGQRLRVACTPKKSIPGKHDLVWKRHKHLNADWDELLLLDPTGKVVDRFWYRKMRSARQKGFSILNWIGHRLAGQDT
jgi:hypothetical protein